MSKSHDNTSSRCIMIFDEMADSTNARRSMLPLPWAALGESALSKPEPWDEFGLYLVGEHVSQAGRNKGDFLDYSTAEGYLNSALRQTSARFKCAAAPLPLPHARRRHTRAAAPHAP